VEIKDRFTHLRLGNVRYSITGNPNKDLVVLMHGLTTPKEVFDEITEKLVKSQFQVLAFDFYGRGKSDCIQPIPSENVYVEQGIELIEKFIPFPNERNLHLIGYSTGGPIAAMTATQLNHKVNSLTLIASAGVPGGPSSPALLNMLEIIHKNGEIDEVVKKNVKKMIFDEIELIKSKSMKNKILNIVNDQKFWSDDTFQTVRGHLKATGGYLGDKSIDHVFENIGELEIPTFILSGTNDSWVNPESAKKIHQLISSSEMKEFEGISHWAFLEDPETYSKNILNFLASA
jgi:3-oxoadipate enol-lactonase